MVAPDDGVRGRRTERFLEAFSAVDRQGRQTSPRADDLRARIRSMMASAGLGECDAPVPDRE
jgi:hypothetical protein